MVAERRASESEGGDEYRASHLALVISSLRTWNFIESKERGIKDQWAGTESFPKLHPRVRCGPKKYLTSTAIPMDEKTNNPGELGSSLNPALLRASCPQVRSRCASASQTSPMM